MGQFLKAPFKMMKSAFYFTLKLFTFLKYSDFVLTFFVVETGQLMGFNMRNIFLEKSYAKCFGQTRTKIEVMPHFLYFIWRKIFLTLYSINWPNLIVWWLLLFEILGNMCIVIICLPVNDIINSELNRSFLLKPFLFIIKKVRTNFFLYQHLYIWK